MECVHDLVELRDEGFLAEFFDMAGGDGLSVDDSDLPAGFWILAGARPAFKNAVNDHRHHDRAAAADQQAESRFDLADFTVKRAGTFRVEADNMPAFKHIND